MDELSEDEVRAILSEAGRECRLGDGEDLLAVAIRLAYAKGRANERLAHQSRRSAFIRRILAGYGPIP